MSGARRREPGRRKPRLRARAPRGRRPSPPRSGRLHLPTRTRPAGLPRPDPPWRTGRRNRAGTEGCGGEPRSGRRPLGRPPPRQDERPACLRLPDERREEVLARLFATAPVGAAAPTLAGQRHPVATAGLRARGDRETPCGHGLDLCPLVTPEREAPTRATRYTYLDHRVPPVVRAPGCCRTRGASFMRPAP